MSKIRAKVLATKIDGDGKMLATVQCNLKMPPIGAIIDIRFGAKRSLAQNRFLWAYYTWILNEGGLEDKGFFCPEALHASLKAALLSKKIMDKGEWKAIEEGSTATLSKVEFAEYMQKIDLFITDFFEISTADFWQQYEDIYKMF